MIQNRAESFLLNTQTCNTSMISFDLSSLFLLSVLSKEAPGYCTAPNFVTQILTEAVGDVPARYMLAIIENVMEDEDTRQYELALSFVDHLFDAMHGSVQFKIYAKVMTGLKILVGTIKLS